MVKKGRSFLRRGSKARSESLDGAAAAAAAAADLDISDDHEPSSPVQPATLDEFNDKSSQTISATPHVIATEPPENILKTRLVSVNKACEEIWKCQEPQQAAMWLELLHHALLRTPLDSYVPAEVFMCISGTALRFQNEQEEEHGVDLLWKVWEEAMWAAAALARVCVGAAWRLQLRARKEWVKCKKQGLEEEDTRSGSSSSPSPKPPRNMPLNMVSTDSTQNARSYSPLTSSSRTISSFKTEKSYPPIPENLPGAMLRFAAIETFLPQVNTIEGAEEQQKWIDRRKSLAEAQRELVLALCHILPEEEKEEESGDPASQLEWTILEAHEPVASMVRSWLESAANTWKLDSYNKEHLVESDNALSDAKPAAIPSDQSEEDASSRTIGSKSTQTIRNTTVVSQHSQHDESLPLERDSSIKKQSRALCALILSGDVDSTDIDWWSTLQVVRAIYQLVAAGWRIPKDEIGEEIIAYCLGIAEKGMTLRANELKSFGTESARVACEERLAASSSAMTAVSAISAAVSVGLIPANMQEITVKLLCRIQLQISASEKSTIELFPTESFLVGQEQEWKADYETFLEQREDCISDIVTLYWVLLAHSSSVVAAMTAFVDMMSLDVDSFENDGVAAMIHRTQSLRSARIAVDAVSGAMWGKPPDIPGISSLRIYWYELFCAMKSISSCLHAWIVEIDGAWDNMHTNVNERRQFVHVSFSLLLEVIESLKRFVYEELLRGEGLLAPDEWDIIVEILDENINKWLCMTDKTSTFAAETSTVIAIRSEVDSLLEGLQHFFVQCVQFEASPFNIVVEDECRVKLYSAMLQKASPYMLPEKGSSLALAVLRSWAATGFAIHRSDQWARTASYIITDVFSVFEDQSFGLYQGNVHAPTVRLEALKLIALGEENEQRLLDPEQFETTDQLSPLEQSLHLSEQYVALVNGSLLPPLMNLFGAKASNMSVAVVIPLPSPSFSSKRYTISEDFYGNSGHLDDEKLSIKADEHELRRFAVKLLGRLYRSGTCEKYRSSLLKMMLTAAINTSMDDFRIPAKPHVGKDGGEPNDMFTGKPQPSLQAIQELEKCLRLPFVSSPNSHECLPPVVDALSSVLIVYGGDPLKERNYYDESWLAVKRCLAIAAILPLSRLGVTYEKKLVLDKPRNMAGLVPEEIALRLVGEPREGTLNTRRDDGELDSTPDVASFIVVSDDHRHVNSQSGPKVSRSTRERTLLSFISVFSSIVATLHTNLESKAARDRVLLAKASEGTRSQSLEILDSTFRALCYDELGAFVRSGVDFPFTKELVPILHVPVGDASPAEVSARCRCAASVIESLSVRMELEGGTEDNRHNDTGSVLQLLLNLCTSRESNDVSIGCQSLCGLVSFITAKSAHVVVDALSNRVQAEAKSLRDGAAGSATRCGEELIVSESLASLLYDIVCSPSAQNPAFLSTWLLLKTFDACCDMYSVLTAMPAAAEASRLLYVRIVGILLNKLSTEVDEATECSAFQKVSARLTGETRENVELPTDGYQIASLNFATIVGDLVVQKLLSGKNVSFIFDEPLGLSYHELMAKETDDIARFLVEDADSNEEAPVAAWLFGSNTLLTMRLGSLKSRYRGWLEILVRTPTRRARRLVRLPVSNSLDSPEIPSTLWDDPTRRLEQENTTPAISDELTRHFTDPSDEMRKAVSVMNKFDEMFGPSNKSSEVGRNVSTSRSDDPLTLPANDFNEIASSIVEWLCLVLKDSASAQCVVEELNTLGFQRQLLSPEGSLKDLDALGGSFLPVERLSFAPKLQRAISIVDRIPPFDTHKIALMFASGTLANKTSLSEQSLEDLLLSSTAGSPRFLSFTEGMGKLVLTRHLKYFSGGLDTSGFDSDGKLSVIWLDRNDCSARTMAVFHVIPLMPEGATNRKRHVGNDNVHIVYVEPGCGLDQRLRRKRIRENLAPSVVSGQFGFVIIFVQTLTKQGTMKVSIRLRGGLAEGIQSRLSSLVGEHIMSESAAPSFVRQIATRADMYCRIVMQDHLGLLNWEERQSQLAAMRRHRIEKS